jgi:hypothetical protein
MKWEMNDVLIDEYRESGGLRKDWQHSFDRYTYEVLAALQYS